MIVGDGRIRDTVYYSMVDTEWPPLRARLEASLYGEIPVPDGAPDSRDSTV